MRDAKALVRAELGEFRKLPVLLFWQYGKGGTKTPFAIVRTKKLKKGLIARAQVSVSQGEAAMVDLVQDAAKTSERAERLRRGEDVSGKISRPMTREEFMKAVGWTEADLRHSKVIQRLYELGAAEDAIRAVIDERLKQGVYRKVLRERLRSQTR